MRAAILFLVLALAKALTLWGRTLPESGWAPLAYLWQDVAVALGFGLFERVVRREWAAWTGYAALVALAAVNVPVARVLSTPLTAPLLRAVRGTLSDSIKYHATAENLAAIGLVLAAGIVLPLVLPRMLAGILRAVPRVRPARLHAGPTLVAGAVVAVLAGPVASARVDTAGLERHPLLALVRTSLPRVRPGGGAVGGDWRTGLFSGHSVAPHGSEPVEDLSHLRGTAAGRSVVLVVLESTAARYLRAYGAAHDPTPNLTALAKRALLFEHAYAVYPESIKGLVSILASRYPGFDLAAERHVEAAAPSLATRLTDAGYATALFHSGRFFYLGMDAILGRSGFARLEDAGDIGGNRESSFGIDEGAVVRRILGWIDALPRARPFLATWLPIAGHHPYSSSAPGGGPFAEHQEVDRYRNALHDGDRALGELLDGLRARGREGSTLVVVAADHGEAFGQHEGNYGHNLALYEENVRVPLLFALPGAPEAVARVGRVASLVDLAPTVLDLLGLDPLESFQGASLLAGPPRMALFFTDYSLGLLGLRDGCFKYIHELESGRGRLFDLCRDPEERVALSHGAGDRTAAYRDRLRDWSAAQVARIAGPR